MSEVTEPTIRIRARMRLLSTAEGGRAGPIRDGYRPNHNFAGPDETTTYIGQVDLGAEAWMHPGETRDVSILFLTVEGLQDILHPGRVWRIQEGRRLVGLGEVLDTNSAA